MASPPLTGGHRSGGTSGSRRCPCQRTDLAGKMHVRLLTRTRGCGDQYGEGGRKKRKILEKKPARTEGEEGGIRKVPAGFREGSAAAPGPAPPWDLGGQARRSLLWFPQVGPLWREGGGHFRPGFLYAHHPSRLEEGRAGISAGLSSPRGTPPLGGALSPTTEGGMSSPAL